MKDTKHVLDIIEEIDDKIEAGECSLDGVGLATLDLEKMYNNMTEEVGTEACKAYLQSRSLDEKESMSTNSILKALELCIRNNFFEFNGKFTTRRVGLAQA